jgi:UDP-N-acetyl-D-galactosamine dehydrogenase
MNKQSIKNNKIAIIGLGYVGLPLAIEFAKHFQVIGFDLDTTRIKELKQNYDRTNELSKDDLKAAMNIHYTSDSKNLKKANVYIITVPTPIDEFNAPNLDPLRSASYLVGKYLSHNNVVIYESTVFPGATEEVCVPILENTSSLLLNKDFKVGYSPERINPGDKEKTLKNITKVTSGSDNKSAEFIDSLYKLVVDNTHLAPSIKVAEAAKVIENTQRDINIGLINELAILFHKAGIDTKDVLDAASTKWNFLRFSPGLVGGHCIGVDPFYLTHKAAQLGHHAELILAGRRINDNMSDFVANELLKHLIEKNMVNNKTNVLILGVTFKENCPDVRNTKVIGIVKRLRKLSIKCDIHDPEADQESLKKSYNISLISKPRMKNYNAVLLCVPHVQLLKKGLDGIKCYLKEGGVFFDLKSVFEKKDSDWRL